MFGTKTPMWSVPRTVSLPIRSLTAGEPDPQALRAQVSTIFRGLWADLSTLTAERRKRASGAPDRVLGRRARSNRKAELGDALAAHAHTSVIGKSNVSPVARERMTRQQVVATVSPVPTSRPWPPPWTPSGRSRSPACRTLRFQILDDCRRVRGGGTLVGDQSRCKSG